MFKDFSFTIAPGWNVTVKPIALILFLVGLGAVAVLVGRGRR